MCTRHDIHTFRCVYLLVFTASSEGNYHFIPFTRIKIRFRESKSCAGGVDCHNSFNDPSGVTTEYQAKPYIIIMDRELSDWYYNW